MTESITIPRKSTLSKAEDYTWLKQEGIRHIEKLASKIWTDYNSHDPGITILEMVCYALADLGYRTSFPLPDLLAADPAGPPESNKSFHTAREILPCNPLTVNDFRKLLIDVSGVQNAWLQFRQDEGPVHCEGEAAIYLDCKNETLSLTGKSKNRILPRGLYRLELLFEEDVIEDPIRKEQVKTEVWKRAHAHRNLCEDFCPDIKMIGYEDLSICMEIEVIPQANVHAVLAQIWYEIDLFLNPQLHFYTLEELLDKGQSVESIFEGPVLDHGFMDEAELEKSFRKTHVYASDLYNIIMDIEGVVHIRKLELTNYDADGKIVSQGQKWMLKLAASDCNVPRIDPLRSSVAFYKGELPFIADPEKVESNRRDLEITGKARRPGKSRADLPIPEGVYRNPGQFQPMTYDMPMVYGVGEAGLPGTVEAERVAQARQLKAYLLFFEQILANYFAQLGGIRHLYRWSEAEGQTQFPSYFYQALSNEEIKEVEELYFDAGNIEGKLSEMVESPEVGMERRNRFLDHLMARFSEQMAEYSLILSSIGGEEAAAKLLTDKARFLRDYPELSRDRDKGSDMISTPLWDSENVAGLQKRTGRMLGIEDISRRSLSCFEFSIYEDNNSGKWHFSVNFPLSAPNETVTVIPFVSIEFETAPDAESGLEKAIRNASHSPDWISGSKLGLDYQFAINHKTPSEILAETVPMPVPGFSDVDEARESLSLQIKEKEETCEGMHIFEHLLLRPRVNTWTDDKVLLHTCVSCPEPNLAVPNDTLASQDHSCQSYTALPFQSANKYHFKFNDSEEKTIFQSLDPGFDSEIERDAVLFSIYDLAQDMGNFLISQENPDGPYSFAITDSEGNPQAKSLPGPDYDADEISLAVQSLLRYFKGIANPSQGIALSSGPTGDPCQYENDPYSFRISVVLPGWTNRFADPNFRKFAERIIREESPAHVFAKICWISRWQMKELESCHKDWLEANAAFLDPQNTGQPVTEGQQVSLVSKLAGLKNYYLARSVLHDCKGDNNDDAIILDNSILGNS